MQYQIFAQCPENISYFPKNFPGFPIPGNISRFPEKICFSPETALVRVVTPREILSQSLVTFEQKSLEDDAIDITNMFEVGGPSLVMGRHFKTVFNV